MRLFVIGGKAGALAFDCSETVNRKTWMQLDEDAQRLPRKQNKQERLRWGGAWSPGSVCLGLLGSRSMDGRG